MEKPHALQYIFPFDLEYDETEQYDELEGMPTKTIKSQMKNIIITNEKVNLQL
jgi:hypothetical protein